MPYPLPLTRTEAYLAYKAGVIQQSDLKPSLAVPRNGIDAWLAYWTGLAADYPKREGGTPHILQEEEAYIAYLCGVINEYPEKCLRRVGAYLRYLISARWGRPDHPLNREELYLSLIKTQFIPSGDPSSDITIDGTAKAPFVDVKMYGDTEQQSYTGKNLANVSAFELGNISSTGAISDDRYFHSPLIPITAGSSYTASAIFPDGTGDRYIRIAFYAADNSFISRPSLVSPHTAAAPSNAAFCRIALVKTATDIMLELGSTATTYEPYVGGTPSPNPSYPQPIQMATGRQVVKVEGKNLLNVKDYLKTSASGLDFSFLDNKLVVSGTPTQTYASVTNEIDIDLPAGNYTFSISNAINHRVYIRVYYEDSTYADTFVINAGSTSRTVTLVKKVERIRIDFSLMTTGTAINESFALQLEKGSTATAYEPYISNDYEINLGKNLLSAGLETGGWALTVGSTIAKATNNNAYRCDAPIAVKPNTEYIFSINGAAFDSFRVVYANAAGTILSNEVFTGTIKTPDNCYQIVFYSSAMKTAYPNIQDIKAQLEVGNTVTPYAPYFTPIELCKLGTYQDYIYKDGSDWKIHKATSKATFGDLNWQDYQISSTGHYRVYSPGIAQTVLPPSANNVSFIGYCSIYANKTSSRTYAREEGCSVQGDGYANTGTIFIYDADYDYSGSAADWKAERGGGQIYFVLKTATDTVITNSALIAQLDALVNGGAENGTTYIKVNATDPNLPGLLYVEAPKYE